MTPYHTVLDHCAQVGRKKVENDKIAQLLQKH